MYSEDANLETNDRAMIELPKIPSMTGAQEDLTESIHYPLNIIPKQCFKSARMKQDAVQRIQVLQSDLSITAIHIFKWACYKLFRESITIVFHMTCRYLGPAELLMFGMGGWGS